MRKKLSILKKESLIRNLYDLNFIAKVYLLCIIIVTMQTFLLGESEQGWTRYNNYVIFKQSYFHLIEGSNLYAVYPKEHWDHFKYSPTFSLLFFIANLPDILGVFLWACINAFTLFFAIKALPIKKEIKVYTLWFILIELITSLQNDQSNALIAGLLVYSFVFFERKNLLKSTFCIVAAGFIKIFGVVGFLFFFFSKEKRKYFSFSILWVSIFFFLPLIAIPFEELIWQYKNWGVLLQNDHGAFYSYGQSVMGILLVWFKYDASKLGVVGMGLILLATQLIHFRKYKDTEYRFLILISLLIWIIIFNHKAESATFIIAVVGMALWFFSQEYSKLNILLIVLAFFLTVLSATDIYPKYIRVNYLKPYLVKVIPCILIWIKLTYDLVFSKYKIRESAFETLN